MKFAHIGDCHLGGWRQPELRELNFKSFQTAISRCIKEKVEFILISGDLFDSAYPPIETLKETFSEFRKVKESNIPVFIIAGSHDYSVAGKSFLDVMEKAGFCKNVALFEEKKDQIILEPTIYKNIAIYGYPGKKSGLEVEDINRIKIQESPGLFTILMLHTTIREAIGNLPVKAVDVSMLPKVNYIALSHLHINYAFNNLAYSGPIFPNSLLELEELKHGFFHIYENGIVRREDIKLKEVEVFNLEINDSYVANDEISAFFLNSDLKDKIVILNLKGILQTGKVSDIDFEKFESIAKKKGAYVFLRSTSNLFTQELDVRIDAIDYSGIEDSIISLFRDKHPSQFNKFIPGLLRALQIEKKEDENNSVFGERVLSECKKIIYNEDKEINT